MSTATAKSEFRNTRDYHIGVVLKREDGRMKGMAIEPHGHVWMDEEEQKATANAPRQESDNPFINKDLELVQSAQVIANRRPIGDTEHPQVQATGGQVAQPPDKVGPSVPAPGDAEAAGADSDGEEGAAQEAPDEEPKADEIAPEPEPKGPTGRTVKEEEESARNAAARQRPTAPGDASHPTSPPAPTGKPAEGSRPATEEVATPAAAAAKAPEAAPAK